MPVVSVMSVCCVVAVFETTSAEADSEEIGPLEDVNVDLEDVSRLSLFMNANDELFRLSRPLNRGGLDGSYVSSGTELAASTASI